MDEKLKKELNIGLTSQEVCEQKKAGHINLNANVRTKSYGRILRDNSCSLFNLINLILLICILIAGSPKNGLFFLVVIWNFAIGVIQEVRSKHTIDRLSLITSPKVYALRDGKVSVLQPDEIVQGEIVRLKGGSQVCADCIIIDGMCQANESQITGESEPILRGTGEELLSGSYIVSGSVAARVIRVGAENHVNRITEGAKYYKKNNSLILGSVRSLVRVITIVLLPLTALMIWKNFFSIDQSFSDAMIATVASVSAMIPGGLILLVSLVMTVSVVKLSRHNTLSQDLYCVESLARVDVLCLDKTGTITEGVMEVEQIAACETYLEEELREFITKMTDENATIKALREKFNVAYMEGNVPSSSDQIPFSSDRKWSLLKRDDGTALIMGAPEVICTDLSQAQKELVKDAAHNLKRIVAFGRSKSINEGMQLPNDIEITAFIILSDKIRQDAKETLDFFARQGVVIKVISGDNPITASKIAAEAGLCGADRYVDAAQLDDYEKIENNVEDINVFGRVSPYQKLDIVKALKAHGHTVAMIGDGANDVLALKEADCSIAMRSGSDAACNVASLVLLDSNFSSLPLVVNEGRKAINNLQRSAGLYLTKTTYAFILTLAFIFIQFTYPFQSIQMTLIGAVTIGMPSFFLALEHNTCRIRTDFLKNVFKTALPSGILTAAALIICSTIVRYCFGASDEQIQTAATFTAILLGYIVIFNVAGRINIWKILLMLWIIAVALFFILFAPAVFDIVRLSTYMYITVAICVSAFFILHTLIFRVIIPRLEDRRKG